MKILILVLILSFCYPPYVFSSEELEEDKETVSLRPKNTLSKFKRKIVEESQMHQGTPQDKLREISSIPVTTYTFSAQSKPFILKAKYNQREIYYDITQRSFPLTFKKLSNIFSQNEIFATLSPNLLSGENVYFKNIFWTSLEEQPIQIPASHLRLEGALFIPALEQPLILKSNKIIFRRVNEIRIKRINHTFPILIDCNIVFSNKENFLRGQNNDFLFVWNGEVSFIFETSATAPKKEIKRGESTLSLETFPFCKAHSKRSSLGFLRKKEY